MNRTSKHYIIAESIREEQERNPMMKELYELRNILSEALEETSSIVVRPVLEVDSFDSPVRGFFLVRFGFMPTITINAHAFMYSCVRDVARTMAHELVHFQLWLRGEPHIDHDERFWLMARKMYDHEAANQFGPEWQLAEDRAAHLMEELRA